MTDAPRPDRHFQTSQPRELLACVEFSAEQADRTSDDPGAFRWLIVAMALAVQNACLCALDYGDDFGTKGMTRTDARIVERWTRAGRTTPPPFPVREPRIVSPLELLRRCADPAFLAPPYTLPLPHETAAAFDDLIELRNTFLHFSQDGWSVDLRELPALIHAAVRIVRHLAVVQPVYLRGAERGHRDRVAAALDRIDAAMEHYAAG